MSKCPAHLKYKYPNPIFLMEASMNRFCELLFSAILVAGISSILCEPWSYVLSRWTYGDNWFLVLGMLWFVLAHDFARYLINTYSLKISLRIYIKRHCWRKCNSCVRCSVTSMMHACIYFPMNLFYLLCYQKVFMLGNHYIKWVLLCKGMV